MSSYKIGDLVMALNNDRQKVLGTIKEAAYANKYNEYAYKIDWCDDEDLNEWYYPEEIESFKDRLKKELEEQQNAAS